MTFKRIIFNRFMKSWMITALVIILLFPVVIGVALFIKSNHILGAQGLSDLLFSTKWLPSAGKFGFLSFIISSLYVTLLAFTFSVPLCLFSAIYITEYAHKRLLSFMQPVIDILAGIPSVVYGMWGILVIVPFVGDTLAPIFGVKSSGYSILSGGIVLSVMCIPYMLSMLIETFKTVPVGLKEARCNSLGNNKTQHIT